MIKTSICFIIIQIIMPLFFVNKSMAKNNPTEEFLSLFFYKNVSHKKVWEQDKIIANVEVKPLSGVMNKLKMKALGVIRAPHEICFQMLSDFKSYEHYSSFVENVTHNKEKGILWIRF